MIISLSLLLSACASSPGPFSDIPAANGPEPDVVREHPEKYSATRVQWGGIIARIENRAGESVVEMVARPLAKNGRPRETDSSSGRFLAHINEFIDPVVHAAGREMTVIGHVAGTEQHKIGEHPYTYPVVQVSQYHLWPLRQPVAVDPYPAWRFRSWYFHDPFYWDPY